MLPNINTNTLFPLFKKYLKIDKVIIDSKSGYSGAGRKFKKEKNEFI